MYVYCIIHRTYIIRKVNNIRLFLVQYYYTVRDDHFSVNVLRTVDLRFFPGSFMLLYTYYNGEKFTYF